MPDWLLLIQWNLSEVSLILIKERLDWNEWRKAREMNSMSLITRINSRKSYNTNTPQTIIFLSRFLIFHHSWNETRTNSRSITKTIRPLSIIIKIESFPSFELSGISGITEWIRETRKQRIGRIGLRERGERDGSDFRAGWRLKILLASNEN